MIVSADLEPDASRGFDHVPASNVCQASARPLIDVELVQKQGAISRLNSQVSSRVDPEPVCAAEIERDATRVAVRLDLKVVLEFTLLTVKNHVDAGVDIHVSHLGIGGYAGPPALRIVAEQVIDLARKRIFGEDAGRRNAVH